MREHPETKAKALANEPIQRLLDSGKTFHAKHNKLPSPSKRDGDYVELLPYTPKPPSQGPRRGGLTPQQKWQRYANLLLRSKAAARRYYEKYSEDINSIRLTPNEVYPNAPVEKIEVPDPAAVYRHALEMWHALCRRRRDIKQEGDKILAKRGGFKRFMQYCEQHPDVYEVEDGKLMGIRPVPDQPVEPEGTRTPPPTNEQAGKDSIRKAQSLSAIDKRMAAERQKISKDDKPRPVMRHHVDANPWLYAKHARNK